MVANVEFLELFAGLGLSEVSFAFFHLFNYIFIPQGAGLVSMLINPAESIKLKSEKSYVLADKGVRGFETGVVELKKVVFPKLIELYHFFFR